jgi:pterin-4a-carbinolamine dehydratase
MSTKLIGQEQIDEAMLMLDKWESEDNDVGQLTKEFEFENFEKAIEFISKIGELVKNLDQKPDILLHSEKIIELMITNYEYEGITQDCLDLAFEIDGLVL